MPDTGRPAILLDRDGTIIVDEGYLGDPGKIAFEPGAVAGLCALTKLQVPLVVLTNQSGIGRGYYTAADTVAVNQRLEAMLTAHGVTIAGWYVCPHAPESGCDCRKPAPGLARQAAHDLGLDLEKSWVIGDKPSDVMLAERIGATGLLVLTGEGASHREWAGRLDKTVCPTLVEAAAHIVVVRDQTRAGLVP